MVISKTYKTEAKCARKDKVSASVKKANKPKTKPKPKPQNQNQREKQKQREKGDK